MLDDCLGEVGGLLEQARGLGGFGESQFRSPDDRPTPEFIPRFGPSAEVAEVIRVFACQARLAISNRAHTTFRFAHVCTKKDEPARGDEV